MTKTITGIAMSGGVDSTATAILQKQKGPIKGFFMKLSQPDFAEQLARVQHIADNLKIDLEVIDLKNKFREHVLNYFSDTYFKALTPNPCVVCNKIIKFGLFHDAILARGINKIATGHYANLIKENDLFTLHKGIDIKKDQSYFLSRLSQEHFARTIFPLGQMTKPEIYDLVEQHGFHDFRGKESQDVCFLENDNVTDFLENAPNFEKSHGNIIMTNGKILGKHQGIHRYTVGQRKGLGISYKVPLYVIGLDATKNAVIVGPNEQLFHRSVKITDLHWLSGNEPSLTDLNTCQIRVRSTHTPANGSIEIVSTDLAQVHFEEPQRAITPGQFAVFYRESLVLGSGVIN
ncbi:MAG: tRNA 2-thiouridine(34) synthase MnmA [Desulfotalea sp.]